MIRTYEQAMVHNARVAKDRARKLGVPEPAEFDADPGPESGLHEFVREECERRGWILLTGSMAHRAYRTVGEPDDCILAHGGRVIFMELKRAKKKPTVEQLGIIAWAKMLGITIHVPRSRAEILSIFDEKANYNEMKTDNELGIQKAKRRAFRDACAIQAITAVYTLRDGEGELTFTYIKDVAEETFALAAAMADEWDLSNQIEDDDEEDE